VEGYTPVMMAIINETNDALCTLLKYGAVDVGAIDNKKMTAYELAINYKN
jgi:ankyrin repeat protein